MRSPTSHLVSTPRNGSLLFGVALLLAAVGAGLFGRAAPLLAAPPAADTLVLRGLRGERLTEADLASGTTIIIVWSTAGSEPRRTLAQADALATRWGRRARVLTVNAGDERAVALKAMTGIEPKLAVFLDADRAFVKKWAIDATPSLLILRDGKVLHRGRLGAEPEAVVSEILGSQEP